MAFDGVAFGETIVELVKGYVSRTLGALEGRVAAIEARQPERGEKGDPGERGDTGAPGERGEKGEPGERGSPGDPGERGEKGDTGEPGRDGQDAGPITREQIVEAILAIPDVLDEAVARYLAANPPRAGPAGERGEKGDPGDKGDVGERGEKGDPGTPAPVVASAIKDHNGELVLTLTDGTLLMTGIRDGAPGEKGADGRDGFSLDDFDVEQGKDGRTVLLKFGHGDVQEIYELYFPVVYDADVYREEKAYRHGDGVSFGGQYWIAQKDTSAKPGEGDDWRLAVRRGRDGRSLYDIARARGYTGNEAQFVETVLGKALDHKPIRVGPSKGN